MTGSLLSTKRRLLCEGWLEEWADGSDHLVCVPSTAYVVQDDKVWFARGDVTMLGESSNALLESEGGNRTIVESVDDMDLEERRMADGSTAKIPKGAWFVEGVFQRSDVKNANKRSYPRGIWEKLIADSNSYAQKNIKERAMLGHLEHPGDGRTDGKEGAIVVTEAKLQEDGTVWGKAEILDTPNGLILKEYTRKNVRWGVSSRGNGSVADNGDVSEASYVLETWDAVMKPSVPGAYPTMKGGGKVSENLDEGAWSKPSPALARILDRAKVTDKKARSEVSRMLAMSTDADDFEDIMLAYTSTKGAAKSIITSYGSLSKLWNALHGDAATSETEQGADTSASSTTVTEADEYVAEVTSLIETPLDDVGNPMFRSAMRQKIQAATKRGTSLYGEGQGTISVAQVLDLQTKLTSLSLQLSESDGDDMDRAIDDAIRSAHDMGEDDRVDGFTRVTESLRERLADALAEAEDLRERLGEAESRSVRAEGQLDETLEQFSEVEGRLDEHARQLKLAEDLLATRPQALRSEAVTAAVMEVCSQVSGLSRYRDILELGTSAGHVEELAERLLPLAIRGEDSVTESHEEPASTPPAREVRPTLPSALVIESSDELRPTIEETAHRDRPRSVVVAEGALKQMQNATAL